MKRPLLALIPILLSTCSAGTTIDSSPTIAPSTNSTEVATTSLVATTSTTEPTVSKLSIDQRLSSAQILDEPERCQIADITPHEGGSSGFPRPVEYERRKDLRVLVVPISIRDYFAALAMQGMFSNSEMTEVVNSHDQFAELSYRMADAMLRAREHDTR